jgi:peptidyl-prolyl cis-trans isomerase D
MTNYAEKLNVSVSNAQVAATIRAIPSVTNPITGAFDEAAFNNFLSQLRYGRGEFEEDIRGDLTRAMLLEALVAGVRAPNSFGELVFAYESETRTVSIAEAPLSAVGSIPAPNDAQMQMFWEESQEALRVPEFRALTLVYARPQDFMARVDIPEARLREEFDARRAALTQPEQRSYVRIAAQTEAQANDAAARLGRGESPDAVAAALGGLQVSRGDNQPRAEVADANVAEAVFSTSPGNARAVRGELSPWVAIRVENVTPAQAPEYSALRDELRQAIAADEAGQMLNDAIGAFEDARSGGTSVADAARQTGMTVVSIPAVESHGHDAEGAEIEALAGQEELLRTAFQTPEGEASDFFPVGEADVIVAVDSVRPSYVRPLDEVRPQLQQAWISRERVRRLREMADEMAAAVRGGESFAAAARASRFSVVVSSRAMDRRVAAQIPARGLTGQMFAAQEGDVVTDLRADAGAMLVAIVEDINRIDPAEQPQVVEAMRGQIQQGLSQSFAAALQGEIVDRANVRRNERLLNQTFRQTGAEEEE